MADYHGRKMYDRLRETYRDYCLCSSWRSRVPAITHRLKGDPVWPEMCFLLSSLHAVQGAFVTAVASFAIAVKHKRNWVPAWPATYCLL